MSAEAETPGSKGKLTANQKRFCEEYAIDRNGVQAYFRAYGRRKPNGSRRSYRVAAELSQRLLEKVAIKTEIARAMRSHARTCGISARRVLRELSAIAFADPMDVYEPDKDTGTPTPRPWKDVSAPARKSISAIKIKRRREWTGRGEDQTIWDVEELEYRFHSKESALDKLCKHLGLTADGDAIEKLLSLMGKDEKKPAD